MPAVLILAGQRERDRAIDWIKRAQVNSKITFAGPKRSLDQNALLWSRLTEIATQLSWHNMKLSPDDWKQMFMAALGSETRLVPNIHANGFVDLGRSSSRLDKESFGELLTLIEAWGAENGVTFSA